MSEKGIAGMIDTVRFPRDKSVLLANTSSEMSVGVVDFPGGDAVVLAFPEETRFYENNKPVTDLVIFPDGFAALVWFSEEIEPNAIELTPELVNTALKIVAYPMRSTGGALALSFNILQGWLNKDIEVGLDGYPTEPIKKIEVTDVTKDAPLNVPQMTTIFGEGLPLKEELRRQDKLLAIVASGIQIPLEPIVGALFSRSQFLK